MLEAERAEVLPCLQESSERGSLTLRGRTGAVKLLEPVRTEKCEDIIHALEKKLLRRGVPADTAHGNGPTVAQAARVAQCKNVQT